MDAYFKFVTLFTLVVVLLIFGLLFYDKDRLLTLIVLAIGVILLLIALFSEFYVKRSLLPMQSKKRD